jgi:hypothetical protein
MPARFCTASLVALAGPLLFACDPTVFDRQRGDAPVFVVRAPAGRTGAFGATLTAYTATVGGRRVSRYAVAGGPSSEYNVYFGFDGDDSDARSRIHEGIAFTGCDQEDCGVGSGASIAAFPEWRGISGSVARGCIAVAATETGLVHIRCEESERPEVVQTVAGPPGEEFGAAAVGIPIPHHALGVAVFGAPAADSGSGGVYLLPGDGTTPVRIDLRGTGAPTGARLGSSLAAIGQDTRSLLVALGTRSETRDHVMVVAITREPDGTITVEPRACLEGESGWGRALALGDLDRDGLPELIVGMRDATSNPQRVEVYSGTDLTTGVRPCGSAQPMAARVLMCSVFQTDDVPCAEGTSEFGSALALGDFNGDGMTDLLVGAPGAAPRGHREAGAIFVLAGGNSLSALGAQHAALFPSSVRPGMRLGDSVAALRGRGRDEIVGGAPRAAEVHIFLCSGLGGDRPDDIDAGLRGCLPPM